MFPSTEICASFLVLLGLNWILTSKKTPTLGYLKEILMELRGFAPAKLFHLLNQNKADYDISAILQKLKTKTQAGENILLFTSRALQLVLTLEKHLAKSRQLKKAIFVRHFVLLNLLFFAKIFLMSFMPVLQNPRSMDGDQITSIVFLVIAVFIQQLSARFTVLMLPHSWIGTLALSPMALSWVFMDRDKKISQKVLPWEKDFEDIKCLEIASGQSMHQDKILILSQWHDILEYDYQSKFESFSEKFPAIEFLTFLILSVLWLGPTMLTLLISLPLT